MAQAERYHHGDLRRALVEAAAALLEELGPEGVSLRGAARRAGVSHAAPYHHFTGKAELVEAVAVHGFERFTVALRHARDTTPGNALARFRATGVAYVRFAAEHPALFRLMNRPELRSGVRTPEGRRGPVEAAAQDAYRVLEDGIEACRAAGLVRSADGEADALAAWSLVHGLAVLAVDGLIEPAAARPAEAERWAEAVTGVLGRGLLPR